MWHGYELEFSEAAIHTVAGAPSATSENNTYTGTAAQANAGDWALGWQSGGSGSGWVKYDWGSQITLRGFKIKANAIPTFDGSDDDSGWTNIPLAAGVWPIQGTSSEGVYDLGAGETYRYFALSFANWKDLLQVEFYTALDPGPFRFWATGPYTTNYADHAFNDVAGDFYADGGGSHYIGWEFLASTVIDEYTITMKETLNVDLEYSDDGNTWFVSDTGVVYSAGVPKVFTPADNDHQYWRMPIVNWKSVTDIDYTLAAGSAVASGTVVAGGVLETEIVTGAQTLILTLTAETWDADIGSDNAQTTALIAGIDSSLAEVGGWDAVVKAGLTYSNVARTSATVVTITLPAFAGFEITADEVITATIPASAVAGASEIVASPTWTVSNEEAVSLGGFAPAVQSWRIARDERQWRRRRFWK